MIMSSGLYLHVRLMGGGGHMVIKVDRTLDTRSEGLGFDSQGWSCVEELGKL